MRNYLEEKDSYECHIIMELLDGGDLENYLKEFGRPFEIEKIQ